MPKTLDLKRANMALTGLVAALITAVLPTLAQAASRTVTYGQGATVSGAKALKLDIHTPNGGCAQGCPTVMFIHGGGFKGGSKDTAAQKYAASVNAQGMAVVSIDYRLVGDRPVLRDRTLRFVNSIKASSPELSDFGQNSADGWQQVAYFAAIEDTLSAMAFLHKRGSSYGLDTSKIVLWGSSAGGITALNVGYGADDIGYERAIPVGGVVNYWGQLASKIALAPGDAPVFITHGENDTTVPYAASPRLYQDALSRGVKAVFFPMPNTGHGGPITREFDGTTIQDQSILFMKQALKAPQSLRSFCYSTQARLCGGTVGTLPNDGAASQGQQTGKPQKTSKRSKAALVIQRADKNKDGALSRSEFTALVKQVRPAQASKAKALFKRLDKNRDGRLTPSELPQGLR